MIHAPVRKMINAGLPVAMASDFNPGSSPSGNMQLILSMACINYRMLPEEALMLPPSIPHMHWLAAIRWGLLLEVKLPMYLL